jgi:hypothetical protein
MHGRSKGGPIELSGNPPPHPILICHQWWKNGIFHFIMESSMSPWYLPCHHGIFHFTWEYSLWTNHTKGHLPPHHGKIPLGRCGGNHLECFSTILLRANTHEHSHPKCKTHKCEMQPTRMCIPQIRKCTFIKCKMHSYHKMINAHTHTCACHAFTHHT